MPRPIRNRRVLNPPLMAGFKPFGMPLCELTTVSLQYDEYESINLVDYQNLSQDQAAERMNISRPTFTRVYNQAIKKIAKAFVECSAIVIEGGNVEFEKQWFKCRRCFRLFEGLESHMKCIDCNIVAENEMERINTVKK